MSGRLVRALILHISIIPHNREEIVFIESCLDAFLDALQFLEDKNKYLNEIIHLIYYISIPKKSLTFWEKCKQAKFVMEKEKYTKSGKNLMSNFKKKKKRKEIWNKQPHSSRRICSVISTSQPIQNRSIAEAKELVQVIHNTKFLSIL